MANLTPQEIVDKQIRNAQNNVDGYRKGVQNTKKKPMERAKAAIPKMRKGFLDAIEDGRVAQGFDSVSDAEWKQATSGKGGDNYARGVEYARPKLLEFQNQIKPFRDALKDSIDQMPNDTKEQRRARMNANFDGMSQFRFQKRGRMTRPA